LLIEELNKKSQTYNPFDVKNILMSTATDIQNDPFSQGAGLTNAYDAIRYVNNNELFTVTNDESYSNIRKSLLPVFSTFNHTGVGLEKFELPARPLPMSNWFGGYLEPNQRTEAVFTITNPSDTEIEVTVEPQKLVMFQQNKMNGTTIVHQQDPILNKTGVYAPNYIKLADVQTHAKLADFFDERKPIYSQTDLMVLNLNFPFTEFMNQTAKVYADDLKISSLYLYDWIDNNNDTKISSDELSLINRAGSWGTVQELRISEPEKKFEGEPIVGVYPVPKRYSFWFGETKHNATSMDYTLSASYYKKQNWSTIWTDVNEITIPPNSDKKIKATLVPSSDLQTGVYQGFLNFKSDKHTANVPVSFVIKQPIYDVDSTVIISGKESNNVLYDTGYIKGAFDMTNRYMAGDWRQFYFDINDENINTAAIEMSWISNNTNLSVFVMDPKGRIIQTNMPSGVFGKFLGWASLDWLGNSPFSQGGGFYPVKNKDDVSTVLYVPINQTGTYSILAHSTLFGGNSTTEPISIAAKFLNISHKQLPSQNELIDQDSILESVPSLQNDTDNSEQEITNQSETSDIKLTNSQESKTDSGLFVGIGIGIGMGIGIAIGVISLLLIRQKSPNP
ncbi:MAG: peptidase S8, partial [Nitrosopumilaceae archaeon]|nr:peptidase S8 [Nitrosopumilaceae archaeon]